MSATTVPPLGWAVAVSLLAGTLLVQGLPALPSFAALIPVLLLALWAGLKPDRRRLLAAALLGLVLACAHGRRVLDRQWPGEASGTDALITGTVEGLVQADPEARPHGASPHGASPHGASPPRSARFSFRVQSAEGRAARLQGQSLRLTWYRTAPTLEPGSRWRLPVRLRPPAGVLNPGGFDFERRALEQRIAATGYVRESGQLRQLSGGAGIDFLRERCSRAIAGVLPGPRARFVQALALGDTRGLSDRDWEVLRATGLTHLIAISGFHVGMVAGLAALLAGLVYRLWPGLGRHWPRPQGMAVCALLAAIGYAALAGFALPTVRTVLMIAAVLLARLLRRPQRLVDALALALIAVLLVDPLSVLSAGFWLSFAGVAWLIWCLPHEHGRGAIRAFLQAQGVAMLGLLPLTVWFFSQASLSAPLVNLVGIPVISLGVAPLAVLGLLLSPLSDTLSHGLWQLAAELMDALWWGLESVAQWPLSLVWLPEPTLPALALALLAVFWWLLPRGVPGKPLATVLLLPLFWPALSRPGPGQVDVVVLDVGQGLSVLVLTGSHALLYDAGPALPGGLDFGESVVVPSLHALGVRRLDRLLLSHGDNDHAGGAAAVLRAFPDTPVSAPEGWAHTSMQPCQRGQHWNWDGVSFRILHPPPLYPYLKNDSSCVLRIEAGGTVALLPGDIGRTVETRLIKEQASAVRADLLIVPHHGSSGSSSAAFVEAVQPRQAVFTVGRGNRFHLPREDALARYRERGSALHDSAGSGALRFRLGTDGVHLQERLRFDRPRYWRHAMALRSGYAIDPSL